MKTVLNLLAGAAIWLSTLPTYAAIENIGVDISPDGTQTVLPFFDESAFGNEVDGPFSFFFIPLGPNGSLTIEVDAASVFGPGPILAAELFIDAFDVDFFNTSVVRVQGVAVGSLADTPTPSDIPVAAGPVGTHVPNDSFDIDNTFFDLSAFLVDLATDSTFTIEIENTTTAFIGPGEEIRIDGINIQAEIDRPITPGGGVDTPEPSSVLVWSLLGCLGSCAAGRRR